MDHHEENDYLLRERKEITEQSTSCNNPNKHRLVTIEPVAAMYFITVMPSVFLGEQFYYRRLSGIYNFTTADAEGSDTGTQCFINKSSPYYLTQQRIQSETSQWTLYGTLLATLPSFVITLWIGSYSDVKSRKISLILPLVGSILTAAYSVIVIYFELGLVVSIFGNVFTGLSGGYMTLLMGVFAYTADVSTHNSRTIHMIIVLLFINIASAIATIGTGYLVTAIGLLYPTLIVLGINILNLLYVCVSLPETVIPDKNAKFFSLKHVLHPLHLVFNSGDVICKRSIILLSLVIFFLTGLPILSDPNITILFLQNSPLCFTVVMATIFSAVKNLLPSVCGLVVTMLFQRRLGDVGLVALACVSQISASVLMAFSTNAYMVFSVPVVGMLINIPFGAVRSLMSKLFAKDDQGALLACIAAVESLCSLIGVPMFNSVYSASLFVFPGLAFITEALMQLVGLICTVILSILLRRYNEAVPTKIN